MKKKYIRDINPDNLKIEYGPIGSNYDASINLISEISNRLALSPSSMGSLLIKAVHYSSPDPYLYSDFSDKHREDYPVAGSVGCRLINQNGQTASIYLVNFYHYEDNHHNIWLWGRNFNGKKFWSKNLPHHNDVPLSKSVQMRLTIDKAIVVEEFVPTKFEVKF